MVNIEYTHYVGEPNVLNKRGGIIKTYTTKGLLYKSQDINHPEIVINASSLEMKFEEINYIKIVELNRYYFVDSIEIIDNNRIKYYLKCDLLYTFLKVLENQYIQTTEVQNNMITNKFLSSRNSVFDVRPQKKKLEFSEPNQLSEEGSIIMVTIKGD